MTYADRIRELTPVDSALIEGWMRLEHGTLDHLSRGDFREAVLTAERWVRDAGEEESRHLARSYGLP